MFSRVFSRFVLASIVLVASGCDKLNPLKPSTFSGGNQTPSVSKNSQVWITPNVSSKMLDMFSKPESWEQARSKTDVFKFYPYHADETGCGFCGDNTFENFLNVVPGGAFRWLNDRGIRIALELGSVKEWNCGGFMPRDNVAYATRIIRNIEATGARVSYIAMDEPFTANSFKCRPQLPNDAIAWQVKFYIDEIHSMHPGVSVGLIETYPSFSVEELEEQLKSLKKAGVRLPFLHLDGHRHGAVSRNDIYGDLSRLNNFCRDNGIDFGTIVWSDDGSSNQQFAGESIMTASTVRAAVGVPDHLIFQNWEIDKTSGTRLYPDNVPEDEPHTMMWLVNRLLAYFGI